MPKRIDPDERQKIIDLLHEHGGNRTKVAGIAHRSVQAVCDIADKAGIPVADSLNTKKAVEAAAAHHEVNTLEALNLAMEVAQRYLQQLRNFHPTKENAEALQKILTSMGIAIDKQLLLKGKPTNINESRKGNEVSGLFSELKDKADEQWRR